MLIRTHDQSRILQFSKLRFDWFCDLQVNIHSIVCLNVPPHVFLYTFHMHQTGVGPLLKVIVRCSSGTEDGSTQVGRRYEGGQNSAKKDRKKLS